MRDPYQELTYTLLRFASNRNEATAAPAFAFVSPRPGAGVSHVTRAIAARMNAHADEQNALTQTLALECAGLERSSYPVGQVVSTGLGARSLNSAREDGTTLESRLRKLSASWQHDTDYHKVCITALRSEFKCLLLDCPSLKMSTMICAVAPWISGIVLVVEADKTTRRQIQYLTSTIVSNGGRVVGHILNKRTYPIPQSVYQLLENGGLT